MPPAKKSGHAVDRERRQEQGDEQKTPEAVHDEGDKGNGDGRSRVARWRLGH
jgi:hypothetical protein